MRFPLSLPTIQQNHSQGNRLGRISRERKPCWDWFYSGMVKRNERCRISGRSPVPHHPCPCEGAGWGSPLLQATSEIFWSFFHWPSEAQGWEWGGKGGVCAAVASPKGPSFLVPSAPPGTVLGGEFDGGRTLANVVLRRAQGGQKPPMEQKGKSSLDLDFQYEYQLWKRVLRILLTFGVLSRRCQQSYHRDNWLVVAKHS